ncbi:MAG: hypothetical protein GY842_13830 [bacterium]|nr:hypothetical protein [bacterium]
MTTETQTEPELTIADALSDRGGPYSGRQIAKMVEVEGVADLPAALKDAAMHHEIRTADEPASGPTFWRSGFEEWLRRESLTATLTETGERVARRGRAVCESEATA